MNVPIERIIQIEIDIPAPIYEVWQAWTTPQGIRSFLAPQCHIEIEPNGPYEAYFNPEAPSGSRGGEDCIILAFQEPTMISFTWNAPPELPTIRKHHTHVIIRLQETGPNLTHLYFTHDGWGTGEDWDKAYQYFLVAWGKIVLPRLQYRFTNGPIDWDHPPQLPLE